MKNIPENSPQTPGLAADNNAAPAASTLNSAASASALILPTRAELNAFWPEGIRGFKPREVWQQLCETLTVKQPTPALN